MDVQPDSLATALLASMGASSFSNLTKLNVFRSISCKLCDLMQITLFELQIYMFVFW